MKKEDFLFCNAHIFTGSGKVILNGSVFIRDGIIREVLPSGAPAPGSDVRKIDLSGKYLMPGLIDCHTHLSLDASAAPFRSCREISYPRRLLVTMANAEATLTAGFTTVRDLGAADGMDFEVRNAVNAGVIRGPRILCAGRAICAINGHGKAIGREINGPKEAVQAVREQIHAGADVIKFMVTGGAMTPGTDPGVQQMSEKELAAGIAEARSAGKKTAAHAKGETGILSSVKAGIDSIEHGTVLTEEILGLMQEYGTFVTFTLSPMHYLEKCGTAWGIPREIVEKALKFKRRRDLSVKMAIEYGIRTTLGTDAGTPLNSHGCNALELKKMLESGFSPVQILISATSRAAMLLGISHETGSIEKGLSADLLVLDRDPLTCLDNFSGHIETVIFKGKILDRTGLLTKDPPEVSC